MEKISEIAKQEDPRADLFVGTRDQLVAAGLVRADQFPLSGRSRVTFVNGQELPRRRGGYCMDERYLRIEVWGRKEGTYRVWVGVPAVVRKQRRDAERAGFKAARAERERAQLAAEAERDRAQLMAEAESARTRLAATPRTADEFRRLLVREVRFFVKTALDGLPRRAEHGYRLAPEALDAALVSVDAVIESVMRAEVQFDHAAQIAYVSRLQAQIAAGDCSVAGRLARLIEPNAAILASEVQP